MRLGVARRLGCCVPLLVVVALLAFSAHAAELHFVDEGEAPQDTTLLSRRLDFFDRAHAYSSDLVFRFAGWADALLENGMPPEDGERDPAFHPLIPLGQRHPDLLQSYVRLSPSVRFRESGEVDFEFDFSARLQLPRSRRRARLLLDRGDWLPEIGRDFEGRGGAETFDRDTGRGTAGVLLPLYERTRYRVAARAGLNFAPEPEPRLQLGLYARRPLGGGWVLRPGQSVFWDAGDGFGEKTVIEVQRLFADQLLLQMGNDLIWSESTRGAELGQYVNLFYFLSNRRMIGTKLGVFEYTHPNIAVDEIRIRFPYRQRIWKAWMYIEIEPGARFLRDNDYRFGPELTITIDLLAGHVPE